jgi:methylated-DNA-[protein]-cysteine S-methyltransferase
MKVETTPFQDRVYAATRQIPPGKVMMYGGLARWIGCGSSQAVGQALRRNPFAPEVPCHRVVAADLNLHGFMGEKEGPQITKKRRLLEQEGVRFDADGRVSADCVWDAHA